MGVNKLYAIILAGGASSRMGCWKGGLPWGAKKRPLLLEHEAQFQTLGAEMVVSVIPEDQEADFAQKIGGEVVTQPQPTSPLTSSVQLGLKRIAEMLQEEEDQEEVTRYLLLNPVDVAPLPRKPLKLLWKVARKSKAAVVRPVVFPVDLEEEGDKVYNGHPVFIHESLWPVILGADAATDRIDYILRDVPMDRQRGVDLNEHVHPWLLIRSMNTQEEYKELLALAQG